MNKGNIPEPKRDIGCEKRILGTLISSGNHANNMVIAILSSLSAECFYYPHTRELFLLINALFIKERPFDFITLNGIVSEHLHDLLSELSSDGYYSANTYSYDIEKLKKLAFIRPKIKQLFDLLSSINNVNDPDLCQELLATGINSLSSGEALTQNIHRKTYEMLVDEILSQDLEEEQYIQTGLVNWPPFPANGMITIAGRSGAGKTFTGIYLMEHLLLAQPGTKALYFNLEMTEQAMLSRHMNIIKETTKGIKQSLANGMASEMLKRNVELITKPGITIDEIELISKVCALKNKIGVIVIDYIGQVQSKDRIKQRYLELDDIAQRLAGLAVILKCPVIVLQQVGRAPSTRSKDDRVPYPSDAAGSQGCERGSHWWIGIDQPQIDEPENPLMRDLFIIKNRKQRGEHGYFTIYQEFRGGRFYDVDQELIKRRLATHEPTPRPFSGMRK